MAAECFQHRAPLIGAAHQCGAEGICVQRGEKVAVYGGIPDKPLLHVQLELHLPAGKASRPVDGELRASAEDPLPTPELLPGDLPDAGIVLRRDGVDGGAAVHDVAHHGLLEGLRVHGGGKILGDVGHAVPDGLDALRGDLVAVHRGGRHHLRDVRVEQQGAVMHDAVAQPVLGVAGELLAVDGQVVAPVEGGVDPHLPQRADHWGDVLAELDLPGLLVLDERELSAAHVRIDGPAAADPAHHGDSPLPQGLHMDLPADILVAAYHDSWGVFPEQEHIVVPKRLVYIFFESLIIEGVIGNIPHSQHIWSPAFCLLHIKFFHITGKAESKRFPLFLFEKGYMVN